MSGDTHAIKGVRYQRQHGGVQLQYSERDLDRDETSLGEGSSMSGKAVGPLGENNSLERSLYKGSE